MGTFDQPVYSSPAAPRLLRPFGDETILHATAAETGGAVSIWESTIQPGGGPHWHTHTRETEVFRVISGRFHFWCGDSEIEGGPGTTVVAPPHVRHRWTNVADVPGNLLMWTTPGGFDQFFVEIDRLDPITPGAVAAIEQKYGIANSEVEHDHRVMEKR